MKSNKFKLLNWIMQFTFQALTIYFFVINNPICNIFKIIIYEKNLSKNEFTKSFKCLRISRRQIDTDLTFSLSWRLLWTFSESEECGNWNWHLYHL